MSRTCVFCACPILTAPRSGFDSDLYMWMCGTLPTHPSPLTREDKFRTTRQIVSTYIPAPHRASSHRVGNWKNFNSWIFHANPCSGQDLSDTRTVIHTGYTVACEFWDDRLFTSNDRTASFRSDIRYTIRLPVKNPSMGRIFHPWVVFGHYAMRWLVRARVVAPTWAEQTTVGKGNGPSDEGD